MRRASRRRLAIAASAGIAMLAAGTQPALAWGKRGHDLVAELAYQRLTPPARQQVDQLLTYAPRQGTPSCPVTSLEEAANWADCMRDKEPDVSKQMKLHHTDRIPLCGPVSPANFCGNGHCASGDIERELPILSDRRADPVARLHALEAVIHLVGDEHQPIHASDKEASQGNPVSYPGQKKPEGLHALWDNQMVSQAVPKGDAGLALLNSEIARNGGGAEWTRGDNFSWAIEANGVARRYAFGALPAPQSCGVTPSGVTQNLTDAYFQQAIPAVRGQLERAGVRLAAVLNYALGR